MEHALMQWNADVSGCSDLELVAGLRQLSAADHKLGAKLSMYIAEVDTRGLYRDHACSSLFEFLAMELHMSEAQAYLRMNAARLAQKYPVIVSMLATGAVHLSALRQISCAFQVFAARVEQERSACERASCVIAFPEKYLARSVDRANNQC